MKEGCMLVMLAEALAFEEAKQAFQLPCDCPLNAV